MFVSSAPKECSMNNVIRKFAVALLSVMAVCQATSAATTTYQYDALGRISVVSDGASVIRYFYDAAGNRTQKQSQGGTATSISLASTTAIERRGSVVLTVTVGDASAIGTVSFYEGGAFLGSAPVIDGVATVELVGWTRGTHTIVVSYSGDVSNAANSVSVPIRVVNLDWLPAVLEILLN
jgi:YD repeat-containing protein